MIKKIAMYLSAYLPIFIVLWVKAVLQIIFNITSIDNQVRMYEWNDLLLNKYLIMEFLAILVIIIVMAVLLKQNKDLTSYLIRVKSVRNRTSEYYLAYSSLFVLSLIGLSFTNIIDIVILLMIVTMLGIVYIKNDLYFINPTINMLFGYVYEVEYVNNDHLKDENRNLVENKLIISKKKLRKGDIIKVYFSEYEFTFIKNETNDDKQAEK